MFPTVSRACEGMIFRPKQANENGAGARQAISSAQPCGVCSAARPPTHLSLTDRIDSLLQFRHGNRGRTGTIGAVPRWVGVHGDDRVDPATTTAPLRGLPALSAQTLACLQERLPDRLPLARARSLLNTTSLGEHYARS